MALHTDPTARWLIPASPDQLSKHFLEDLGGIAKFVAGWTLEILSVRIIFSAQKISVLVSTLIPWYK
jgi:hypothetical protein